MALRYSSAKVDLVLLGLFGPYLLDDRFHETSQIGPDQIETQGVILRSRVKYGVSKEDTDTISPVAVLRDARKSALLRTRLSKDIDMIRTSETKY
jgi:hypothetical protein